MTINQAISTLKQWLFEISTVCLLLLLAVTVLRTTGLINVPILHAIDHITLAYLCGALYLLRR